jgi:hypothetical protein
LAAACQVRTEVAIDVADDGSGTVTVSVGLDTVAAEQVPELERQLRVDDLEATGWTVTGPSVEEDGYLWVRATKPFENPEEAGAVLTEISGTTGPFRDFRVTRERSFAHTAYDFEGTVDLTGGLASFGDEALTAALGGEPLGESPEDIEARIGSAIDDAVTFDLTVNLPGDMKSNAPTQDADGAVWEPSLASATPVALEASSEVTRSRTLVLVGVAVVAGLCLLGVVVVSPIRRRRRRTRRPRGRHAKVA